MNEETEGNAANDSGTMADFVAQHRSARLPKIQRQNQLVQRQRSALYGEDEKRLREWRGDYEEQE